jgi:hypothetical protein
LTLPQVERPTSNAFDVFLSYASEDRESIASPLYEALRQAGITVWFDQALLKLGDSFRRKIDLELSRCRYGVVILSPRFLAKEWPQRELDGLLARESDTGKKAILPIWHELDIRDVIAFSPTLAGRFADRSSDGLPRLVAMIHDVIRSH